MADEPTTITVHGRPAPQGSKDQFGREVSKLVKPWREAVRGECQRAIEAGCETYPTGPVVVSIEFRMPRPKAHYRTGKHAHELRADAPTWVDKTPDLDKCLRSTLDALTASGIIGDDRQIARLADVDQKYGARPGAWISVGRLPE